MKISAYFEPYLEYILAKGRCEKTAVEHRRFLERVIGPAIGDRDIMEIRKIDVVLVEGLGRHFGEHGSQRSVCLFRRLMNYVEDRGDNIPFDWRSIPLPKVPTCPIYSLTDEEFNFVCDNIEMSTVSGLRQRALYEILFASGMRIGEAVSLNRADIDWEKKEAIIINVKTRNKEKVYFSDRSLFWLKKYLGARKDDLEPLFVSGRGRLLEVTTRNYTTQLSKKLKDLGFKKRLHHHLFRKSYTTKLLNNQVNIKAVQILSRHKSERTTLKHYAAVTKDQAKDEHQRVMCMSSYPLVRC